ncbi:F-box/kelch-repeat protein [Sesamum alatum]|uniref:F-box/kelch-repeat protein n=1 Tax=Sesamum alatum TaxID=300844 RepID=A0AAE2CYM1_9LAMI|nr:F-box/kelch-repeat protein [Sesamum alatum]
MSNMPPEIIIDILSRLPVKPLLRFRCVSKQWRSLIDGNDLIKLHLQHSSRTNSNRTLVVDSIKLFYVDLDSFELLDIGNTRFKPQSVAGSCDGLVLLVFKYDNIVLWNPSTRKLSKLPTPPLEYFRSHSVDHVQERYGLGYDSKHDDYKVVRVVGDSVLLGSISLSSETHIYSLKSNSWKKVQAFPCMLSYGKRWGAYLNGALHTVAYHDVNSSQSIVAFDLGKEEYYEVPKPERSGLNLGLSSVEALGGCLAAVVPGERNSCQIWVMKEYRAKGSWNRLLCFHSPFIEPCIHLCPLAYSKSGEKVLLNYAGMCLNWYNLRNKTVEIACVNGLSASFDATPLDPLFHAEVCVQSLVSPHSPHGSRIG